MKTILFFLAMLVSVAASTQVTNVEPLGVNYTDKTVSFRVWWNADSRDATHLSKVWVWIDYIKINSNNTTSGNTWTRAAVSAASPTASISYDGSNRQGFWLQGDSGNYSATVTVRLNITESNFNWCAYVSDYPPNVTANSGVYTLRGTPPFTLTASDGATQPITGTTLTASALTITPITIIDATACPGVFCIYQGSDLFIDATHLCQQRTSGAQNWEAWIKDVRDNHIYRIVQMPTNTWWMAEDLMWDGKPNPTATGYTIRGTDRSCGAHYGCGRFYNSTATGAGPYAGDANSRRVSDVCPMGWVLPSSNEFCPYATTTVDPQPYLGAEEFGGPDTYGLTLWLCAYNEWTCGTVHTAYVCGFSAVHWYYRSATVTGLPCSDATERNGKRNVRCVRDL